MPLRLVSFFGLCTMLLVAWGLSEDRRKVSPRILVWGLGLQLALGVLVLRTPLREVVFPGMQIVVQVLIDATLTGARFTFGTLSEDADIGAVFAFQVLPVIVFVSALSAIVHHLRLVQLVVGVISWCMRRTLHTSGAETLGAALLIFFGIESVSVLRAYVSGMTRSELLTIMTTFMATIAGSVMVTYAAFGAEPGHLLTASLMSAPAAIMISKILVPETGTPPTAGETPVHVPVESHNLFDAILRGTNLGVQMALAVGAMVLVFVALIGLIDIGLVAATGRPFAVWLGQLFQPIAYLLGVPASDTAAVGQLLGTKTVLNEFLAYLDFGTMVSNGTLSPRGATIATYALCGFANPGSIGIVIAGMDALAPERRREITQLSVKAFLGGTLACFMTACVAGMLT